MKKTQPIGSNDHADENNGVSIKRPEIFNASPLKGSVATAGTVDNPTPYRTPLPAYEGISRAPAEDTKVITIGKGVVFSGKVIEADNVKLEGKADGKIASKTGLRNVANH